MALIHRDVYLTKDIRPEIIKIVRGSQIGIELEFKDYTIPTGATVKAYARKKGDNEKTYTANCTLSGSTVTLTPPDGFFVYGNNLLQVEANGTIIPVALDVRCEVRVSDAGPAATPEQVLPYVERAETAATTATTQAGTATTKATEAAASAAAAATTAALSAVNRFDLGELQDETHNAVDLSELTWEPGYIRNNNGTFVGNSEAYNAKRRASDYFAVEPGDMITVADAYTMRVALYNASKTFRKSNVTDMSQHCCVVDVAGYARVTLAKSDDSAFTDSDVLTGAIKQGSDKISNIEVNLATNSASITELKQDIVDLRFASYDVARCFSKEKINNTTDAGKGGATNTSIWFLFSENETLNIKDIKLSFTGSGNGKYSIIKTKNGETFRDGSTVVRISEETQFGINDTIIINRKIDNTIGVMFEIPSTMKFDYFHKKSTKINKFDIPSLSLGGLKGYVVNNFSALKEYTVICVVNLVDTDINVHKYFNNDLFGKKWVVVGDSLTEANYRTTKHYHDYISEETGINVVNFGVSGTGYKARENDNLAFYQRVLSIPTDADLVTIFGSGNDYGYCTSAMGTSNDSGTSTIGGCINTTIDNILSIIPTARLGVVSPTPWKSRNPNSGDIGMTNYVALLKEICEKRSIPFLDLYHCSNLRPWDNSFLPLAYSKDTDDGGETYHGIHPDEVGHAIIKNRFKSFIKSII